MLTLKKKIEQQKLKKEPASESRVSIRDKLLVKGMLVVLTN